MSAGWLVQASAEEVLDGRDAQVTRWQLFLPADVAVSAGDRVVADPPESGMDVTTFEVDGVPNVVSTPSGPHHTECYLRLVEG